MLSQNRTVKFFMTALLLPFLMAGCPNLDLNELVDDVGDILEDLEIEFESSFDSFQDDDILIIPDRDIFLDDDADIIIDISDDLEVEALNDITLLVFDNFTGVDIYLEYIIDQAEFQSVFVLAGETLVIEYPCLFDIELILEEDYDPFTGVFLESFDLTGSFVENGIDFFCGEAVVVEIDVDTIFFTPEPIDLF